MLTGCAGWHRWPRLSKSACLAKRKRRARCQRRSRRASQALCQTHQKPLRTWGRRSKWWPMRASPNYFWTYFQGQRASLLKRKGSAWSVCHWTSMMALIWLMMPWYRSFASPSVRVWFWALWWRPRATAGQPHGVESGKLHSWGVSHLVSLLVSHPRVAKAGPKHCDPSCTFGACRRWSPFRRRCVRRDKKHKKQRKMSHDCQICQYCPYCQDLHDLSWLSLDNLISFHSFI